jgi:hypothetical protein
MCIARLDYHVGKPYDIELTHRRLHASLQNPILPSPWALGRPARKGRPSSGSPCTTLKVQARQERYGNYSEKGMTTPRDRL